ncbi:hypothetical protein AWC38_SpisGene13528 [Stylophora pistillata]|uniref:RNA-directed DNA polymerase from mobile element jockey n=1 Tax=Stylophora pistillata TaxID=50429 RepID=A0A2B4RWH0_STYPI|nr:hypothetical protein AWC38_SpisGene13528 [Stylophora pistillata]
MPLSTDWKISSRYIPGIEAGSQGHTVADIVDEIWVTEYEALNASRAVQTRKSTGPDEIPNVVLKVFAPELTSVLVDLYNASLREGYLPSLLKRAIVRPLPKQTPAKMIEDDTRPMSLTSQMAKLMEGFTLRRILPDVMCELDPKQFTVAGKSTCHAICCLLHLAYETLDSGNCWVRFFFADF